jgi:hypothetical protein
MNSSQLNLLIHLCQLKVEFLSVKCEVECELHPFCLIIFKMLFAFGTRMPLILKISALQKHIIHSGA